jgi:hypothetical protein
MGTKTERLLAGEWARLGWARAELERRPKSALEKVDLAARLRQKSALMVSELAGQAARGRWGARHHPVTEPPTNQGTPWHIGIVVGCPRTEPLHHVLWAFG